MKITIWGCRGSLPSPGLEKNKYGGNTSCVQVQDGQKGFIIDGGSGILRLGTHFDESIKEFDILLTHLHLDHIMGLGYFKPLYDPSVTVNIWGPSSSSESLSKRLKQYFSPPLFPVRLNELRANIVFKEIGNDTFSIGNFEIQSEYVCHPGPTVGYRCRLGHKVFTFLPDHEPALGSSKFPHLKNWSSGYNLAHDADLLFHDGQYTADEYIKRIGWGHSSMEDAIKFGEMAKVKKLVFFHYDPVRSDFELEQMLLNCTKDKEISFDLKLGRENEVFYIE
ncbi:MBL fold metallo-hydrolase [Namhaeicola litoreus]|uniref:MBL fold metallo-hydrolase n=1 Tax=Namhaeicola litoreus TaxID=1052145 RepID=A0ABW3Y3H2_9FLAO